MSLPPLPIPSDSTTSDTPTSTSSASPSELMKYLCVPILISISNELNGSNSTQPARIFLPSATDDLTAIPCVPVVDQNRNFRPVIGILSHPGDGASGRLNTAANVSYIAASYVKFVESAGARVIPLICNEPREVLFRKLNLVNGVIFTGGRDKIGPYFEVVEAIFKILLWLLQPSIPKEILRKNDAGDHVPLLAICLGFELITKIVSEDNEILESFSAKGQASTLLFRENIDISGTVFQRFPPALLKKLSTECLVMQNHKFGISPAKFQENKKLCSFFNILTTSVDENEERYVSTVQAHRYPVTAVQWHPEKNAFEWGLSGIPHSEDAIQVTQHVANFFIGEARKSMNRPPAQKVLDNLIYNYGRTFSGKAGRGFDEVYIFSKL